MVFEEKKKHFLTKKTTFFEEKTTFLKKKTTFFEEKNNKGSKKIVQNIPTICTHFDDGKVPLLFFQNSLVVLSFRLGWGQQGVLEKMQGDLPLHCSPMGPLHWGGFVLRECPPI